MSLSGPPRPNAASDSADDRTALLELDDTKLRAALNVAGFDEERSEAAIAALRTALKVGAGVTGVDHPGMKQQELAGRFRTLVDVTPQLVWHSAEEGHCIWASPNWLSYTGQSQEESTGQGWLAAIHPDDREVTMQAWHEAADRGSLEVEHRIRRGLDGAWRMHQTRSAPLRGRLGRGELAVPAPEWIGTSTDIEDIRRLEDGQHALLLELQHRTRNLLALVQVIAHRSLPPVPGRSDFNARLASLGRVQGFLARNATWSVPLRDLIEAELRALTDGGSERAQVMGPQVDLPGEVVQPIALALHELASNAAKHGAIAQRSGQLTVTWHLENSDGEVRLVVEWCESGVSMPQEPIPRRFGCQVIERTVPYQLHGEARLEQGSDGIRCRLALPFSDKIKSQGDGWAGSARASR